MTARPPASSDLVRRQMSRQLRTGTVPELALRRALHRRGLRFRVDRRIGRTRPDIIFTRARIAVFVMGDFWHSCPLHATRPKNNADWWAAKLDANRARDDRQRTELEGDGWLVVWVWECEDAESAADDLVRTWRGRTGRGVTDVLGG